MQTTIALSIALTVLASSAGNAAQAPSAAQDAPDKARAVPKAGMCVHEAPKNECFICDPKLRDKGRLWCNEHSLYEDECFLCHPELKKKQAKPAERTPPSTPADHPSR